MNPTGRRIHGKRRLHFNTTAALREYYEAKYREGGYNDGGYTIRGVNISAAYHQRRREAALRLLDPQPGETILDAGCGSGALSAALAGVCSKVHAVDIAGNALDPRYAALPNLCFSQMDVESTGFADAAVDKIVCVETIEHLLRPQLALVEFHRILKSHGRLVLTYPTINRTRVKQWHLGRKVSISEHLNEWSFDELLRHAAAAGWRLQNVEGIAFDFGAFMALKHLHRALASGITKASLQIRNFPRNSMFVCAEWGKA